MNQKQKENYQSICLILLSTFLYYMNIYIIKPTSTEYVMELGENRALTGAIIGIMTGTSVLSTFIYSTLTNESNYITPIITSSILMIMGNIFYATAYTIKSFCLMMIGCGVAGGLGCPLIINRRYVSEVTPVELRTGGIAVLVGCGCIGAALGPLVDMLFHNISSNNNGVNKVYILFLGWIELNELNGPGYLMSLLWTIYTIIVSIMLKEPNKNNKKSEKNKILNNNNNNNRNSTIIDSFDNMHN